MEHPDSRSLDAPSRDVRQSLPVSSLLRIALSMDFASIHTVPDQEQRRAGVLGVTIGGLLVVVGFLFARFLVHTTGIGYNKLFLIGVGLGGVVAGIGAYRVGVSFFPGLKGAGRLAALGRMAFVLVVLCGLGFGALVLLTSDG